ncbi:MAG: 2-oxo acid dehydrogenase subunit E2 [Arcicella sp.]|nr:2-oxo acid dehydrogenase subunit E2 [Arcicella sp.]
MSLIEIIMPKMGESIMEATILKWLKKVGDNVEADEYLLEVATDKIDTEVPSSHTGILIEILVLEGEVAEIGKPICIIQTNGEEQNDSPKTTQVSEKLVQEILEIQILTGINLEPIQNATTSNTDGSRFYSPLVLSICKEEKISNLELESIAGTGLEGRVTKRDIFVFLESRTSIVPIKAKEEIKPKPMIVSGNDEIIQMDRMRRMIADRMVESVKVAPHVTSFVETDMTNVVFWRNNNKDYLKKQYGVNITFTPILVEAIAKAIRDFPQINASVNGDKIIVKAKINIGMAVALPSGNLIVPVIHNADQYDLIELTKKINDLTKRARENKLKPEDLEGGTYTFSNIGTFGNIMGTPIIMQPQVAIMAFGAIQKKPAVIETPQGDFLGIRQKMFISHSYDHRVVDGSLGGQFVKRVSDYLEGFEIERKLI